MKSVWILVAGLLVMTPAIAWSQETTSAPAPAKESTPQPAKKSSRTSKAQKQEELEQVQTRFLNRFGGVGFSNLLTMEKVDNRYRARVKTIRGHVAFIEIDPITGNILTMGSASGLPETSTSSASSASSMDDSSPWPRTNWQQYSDQPTPQSSAMTPAVPPAAEVVPPTSCVTRWKELNDAVNKLQAPYELTARRMMLDVWDQQASGMIEECTQQRMQLDQYIAQAMPAAIVP